MRKILEYVLRVGLEIFFRRVDVIDIHKVPLKEPVIIVLNHNNGLMDPIFILGYSPRPVSFLAKSTLFKMPFLGFFVKMLDSIPVYRAQDVGMNREKNVEMFAAVKKLLQKGGSIALFPEGISHSDPMIKPLKSGAARIAVGSQLERVWIVPAGLYYTAKWTFRSSAMVLFGDPIEIHPDQNPDTKVVTQKIAEALKSVAIHAESHEVYHLISSVEKIGWNSEDPRSQYERRKLFLERYEGYRKNSPEQVQHYEKRVREFEQRMSDLKLSWDDLERRPYNFRDLLEALLLFPFALPGIVIHYPIYRLLGILSVKLSRGEDDLISTIKYVGAFFLLPGVWAILSIALLASSVSPWFYFLIPLIPLFGVIAVKFVDRVDVLSSALKRMSVKVTRPRLYAELLSEQKKLAEDLRSVLPA